MAKSKFEFCEQFVFLDRSLIRFDGRPYLRPIYESPARNLVWRASRQVEKSTFIVNTILYLCCRHPGIHVLLVCPRQEQTRVIVGSRLIPCLEQSPLIRRCLLGEQPRRLRSGELSFANGSRLYVRAAFHNADSARGISADVLLIDEYQDVADGVLPVLRECLSHSNVKKTILTGTPKSIDNPLDAAFARSTANEWTMTCGGCTKPVILDERSLGTSGVICPDCQAPVDPATGRWVSRHPDAKWGEGFWVNAPMVPWTVYHELLEKQSSYDLAKFKNEVLGMPALLGDRVVTRAELEACCGTQPMITAGASVPRTARQLIAGIDWGGGGVARTVVVLGFMHDDFRFEVLRMERFRGDEDPEVLLDAVARVCRRYPIRLVGADGGGNGHVNNRLLLGKIGQPLPYYAIHYSQSTKQPVRDGVLQKWTVDRTDSLGTVFTRIKRRQVIFPRLADMATYLDEFECVYGEYDDHQRRVRYRHPETRQDDALHATNYALQVAIHAYHMQRQY